MIAPDAIIRVLSTVPLTAWPHLARLLRGALSGEGVDLSQAERDALAVYTGEQFDRALATAQGDGGYQDTTMRAIVRGMLTQTEHYNRTLTQLAILLEDLAQTVRDGRASLQTAQSLSQLAQFCAALASKND